MQALKLRGELYAHVTVLKERAEAHPQAALKDEESNKYLIIRKSENIPNGYTVNIREEVVAKGLETADWLVVLFRCEGSSLHLSPKRCGGKGIPPRTSR